MQLDIADIQGRLCGSVGLYQTGDAKFWLIFAGSWDFHIGITWMQEKKGGNWLTQGHLYIGH